MFLYNTLRRKKEKFMPIKEGCVGIYACGPTVYNYAHIGNMRTYIFEDTLRRIFKYLGYKINYVMNVTDVGHLVSDADDGDDKMEMSAQKEGKSATDIADFYSKAFFRDFKDLNCVMPDIVSKATEHIDDMIKLIERLEKNGFTYKISDGIYFDTSKFERYGRLAGQKHMDGIKAGARVEFNSEKKNPSDFALWKFSPKDKKRQMEWPSPWGIGFPGWHIECS
ncbi:MAG: class I tRNA ligase family protein, partial [Elusimicrobiales bacterium]|nr:class I tRNA ligase family protein [Elusimicrobiales bacterium]